MTDPISRPLRVFLCHSSGDKPIVRELYRQLDTEGWIDVWLDEVKLLPGHNWDMEIEKAVEVADTVIVCLSNNSVTKEGYVQSELSFVLDIARTKPEETIFVIPLRLDDCPVPRRLRVWQYVDYFPVNQRKWAYQRILESLKMRATRLNLLTSATKDFRPTPRSSPKSVATYSPVSPEPKSLVKHPEAARKRKPPWFYGRLAVILMLISGLIMTWPTYSEVSAEPSSLIRYLVLLVLLLVTLGRWVPWRFMAGRAMVRLERLVAGIACLFTVFGIVLALLAYFPSRRWGYWLSTVGVDLATINILFELRSTIQKGQKFPWWAWLLAITMILPWLVILLLSLIKPL